MIAFVAKLVESLAIVAGIIGVAIIVVRGKRKQYRQTDSLLSYYDELEEERRIFDDFSSKHASDDEY